MAARRTAAQRRLAEFADDGLDRYATERDRPDHEGSSMLSPHLRHGELSPTQVWHAIAHADPAARARFLHELLWREFCLHVLSPLPGPPGAPPRPAFSHPPWPHRPPGRRALPRGRTGPPIGGAGLRPLFLAGRRVGTAAGWSRGLPAPGGLSPRPRR